MSDTWQNGSSRRWRALRAAVLARDGYRCRAHPVHCAAASAASHECSGAAPLSGGAGVAGHAHHTKGKRITGDDPTHIVAACPACNLAIGDPDRRPDPAPVTRTRW